MQTLYCGASSFCISNAAKSGVRFVVFDKARSYVSRDQETGNWSTSSNLAAGLVAGAEESVLVVTPGETLKTRIIENRQMPRCQRFNGVFDAIRSIIRTDGPSGIYKGVIPVTFKQSSNAMVRFTSYNAFLSLLDNTFRGRLDSGKPAVAGASAGVVTVYATMPFDSVKTCLQAASATTLGTYECITSMIRGDGITSLWRGTTPRLMRLTVRVHHLQILTLFDQHNRSSGPYHSQFTTIHTGFWR